MAVLERPVVLVGPMGVGKTTIGKKLARSLRIAFIDTDSLVVQEHGAIDKIFSEQGEEAFRGFEEQAVASAISSPAVVATGGGAVLSATSRARLAELATVVYLSTDGRHIQSRLRRGNRPLLKDGMSDWKRIYDERRAIYESVADFEVETSGKPLTASVREIKSKLGLE
jgi:shikimate kinase